mgnify:CR=1 FL=1
MHVKIYMQCVSGCVLSTWPSLSSLNLVISLEGRSELGRGRTGLGPRFLRFQSLCCLLVHEFKNRGDLSLPQERLRALRLEGTSGKVSEPAVSCREGCGGVGHLQVSLTSWQGC